MIDISLFVSVCLQQNGLHGRCLRSAEPGVAHTAARHPARAGEVRICCVVVYFSNVWLMR